MRARRTEDILAVGQVCGELSLVELGAGPLEGRGEAHGRREEQDERHEHWARRGWTFEVQMISSSRNTFAPKGGAAAGEGRGRRRTWEAGGRAERALLELTRWRNEREGGMHARAINGREKKGEAEEEGGRAGR